MAKRRIAMSLLEMDQERPQGVSPLAKVEREGLAVAQRALALQVRDQASFDDALALARRIRAMKDKVHELTDPTCEATHKAHKAATEQRAKMLAAVDGEVAPGALGAEDYLKDQMGAFEQEQHRVRDAALHAAEEERERLEQEEHDRAARETQRLIEEADALRAKQAAAAKSKGDKKLAARILAQPLEVTPVQERAVFVAPVEVLVPSAHGVSFPDHYTAQVTSLKELVAAACPQCGKGRASLGHLLANQVALNASARALREHMNIPGVKAVKSLRPSIGRGA